jgi:hypothetical protein
MTVDGSGGLDDKSKNDTDNKDKITDDNRPPTSWWDQFKDSRRRDKKRKKDAKTDAFEFGDHEFLDDHRPVVGFSGGSSTTGTNRDATDGYSTGYYSGYGDYYRKQYAAASSYSYRDAFDDSDTAWYRQNNFRYGAYRDYSPSSLFRSSFSYSTWAYGANDDKNKAIRALRALKRNANTVADGTKKVTYDIKFSDGADINSIGALSTSKSQTIYVSSDAICDAITPEAEDTAIDALTGFVLLRVQMTQSIESETIRKINETDIRTMPMRIVKLLKNDLTKADAAKLSATAVDDYFAGVVAKSMLVRLSRRSVVDDWGGFAPYFVRYAKKFAAVKENLLKQSDLSVELLAAKIAYNMMTAEDEIEIDPEVAAIAEKHLGEKLASTEILDACRALMQDLREYVRLKTRAMPDGSMEQMLFDGLNEIIKQHGAQLEKNRLEAEEMRAHMHLVAAELDAAINSIKAASSTGSNYDFTPLSEAAAAQIDKFNKLASDSAADVDKVDAAREDARAAVAEYLKKVKDKIIESRNASLDFKQKLFALKDSTRIAEEKYSSAKGPANFLSEGCTFGNSICNKFDNRHAAADLIEQNVINADSPKTLEWQYNAINQLIRRGVEHSTPDLLATMPHWTGDKSTMKYVERAVRHHAKTLCDDSVPVNEWHSQAVEEFLQQISNSSKTDGHEADAAGYALSDFNQTLFNKLLQSFESSDGGIVAPPIKDLSQAQKDALQSAAESLGIPIDEFYSILKKIFDDMKNRRTSKLGQDVIDIISDKLRQLLEKNIPTDEGLFGGLVAKINATLRDADISQINKEALNAAEEDYVAYLDHNNASPKIHIKKATDADKIRGKKTVSAIISQNRGAIARVREALQFQDTQRVNELYGTRSGDLDDGSLHKLRYDSEYIWSQKTVSQLPDVAVGILVDQSGSMNCHNKIKQAREMCIILSEALRTVGGLHLHIYGHTANSRNASDLTLFEHYSSPRNSVNADLGSLANIAAHENNYDGYAIKEAAKLLAQDPAKRKYLFIIADGLPHGRGYEGKSAEKHVKSVCAFVRTRLKIPTYAFAVGVGEHYSDRDDFIAQYGAKNVLFLSRISQCLPQITRFLRNAIKREKTLVDVST